MAGLFRQQSADQLNALVGLISRASATTRLFSTITFMGQLYITQRRTTCVAPLYVVLSYSL
eukprot:6470848-Amphidinium_carterae.2